MIINDQVNSASYFPGIRKSSTSLSRCD